MADPVEQRCPTQVGGIHQDLHTDHSVTIRAELDSNPIVTDNSFKQGCTHAIDLFNIVLGTIVRQLLPQLRKLEVKIACKTDGQLMHNKNPDAEVWFMVSGQSDKYIHCEMIIINGLSHMHAQTSYMEQDGLITLAATAKSALVPLTSCHCSGH